MSEEGWYESEIDFSIEEDEMVPKKLSQVESYSSNLENSPCFEILKESLSIVAQEHKGEIIDHVFDTSGEETKCDIAVIIPNFTRGVGLQIDRLTGQVKFLYDDFGQGDIAKKIAEEITQNYTSIALIRSLKALGYIVEEKPSETGDVKFEASSYIETIKASISRRGEVNLDFIGFSGRECEAERGKLTNVMLRHGTKLKVKKIRKKNGEKSKETNQNEIRQRSKGGL